MWVHDEFCQCPVCFRCAVLSDDAASACVLRRPHQNAPHKFQVLPRKVKMSNDRELVERLAYVLREWEESHATFAPLIVNGRAVGADYRPWDPVKTECQCQHCKDARVVLADVEGDERDGATA